MLYRIINLSAISKIGDKQKFPLTFEKYHKKCIYRQGF